MIIPEIRNQFVGLENSVPVLNGDLRKYINFDNAASTPSFRPVLDAVNEFMPWYSSVHRGTGFKSRLSTEAYESARQIVGQFVGADMSEHTVIFGRNTTDAINKVSYRLGMRRNDMVLISGLEHHSNDLPWRARAVARRIGLTDDGGIDRDDYEKLLAQHGSKIKLVAISGASNVTGHIPDIHWFARKAHEVGAQILVDCAQLAAHRSIRIGALSDPDHLDYVGLSAHKMYAPFGTGALIGRKDTFLTGAPEYSGGGTIDLVSATRVDWAEPADREEAGSPNVVGAVALARSIQVLKLLGLDNIAKHEAELTSYALKHLAAVPEVTVYGDTDPSRSATRSGVIPFAVSGIPHNLVAAILGFEWGIGVRSGCFCAHPYVAHLLGLDSMFRKVRRDISHGRRDRIPGLIRVSFGAYNTKEEVDVLIEALQAIVGGKHARYRQDVRNGEFTPVGAKLDFGPYFSL
ncbi:MAG TPA: aminotransferase class V-fold PLP-dependent enzyme [Candidatus Saccharimonadales bacterium]